MKKLLEEETVFAETHVENVYASVSRSPYTVRAQAFFLKRFAGETEETLTEMHACRFLKEDNLCQIYDVRPTVCRKHPYTVYVNGSLYHAYYTKQEESECQGYRAKRRVKTKWLTPWIKPLIQNCNEIYESIQKGFFIITEVKKQ